MKHIRTTAIRPLVQSQPRVSQLGTLLREWRDVRGMSQLALALRTGSSARHLSFIETGKSQPSREMVSRLADALDMPLRERNALLLAAGFAPEFSEGALDSAELSQVRRAIDFILEHQEPYPAFLLNRRWDILKTNAAAERVGHFLLGDGGGAGHTNMLRQFFDPADMRRVVVNWEEVAGDLLRHLHDEVAAGPSGAAARALLDEILGYPGVPSRWHMREVSSPPPPVVTVHFRKGTEELRFFSTITTFGTARDVTIDELRIECTFPADERTARFCRELAAR